MRTFPSSVTTLLAMAVVLAPPAPDGLSLQDDPDITALPGFKVEAIYSASPEEGSWVSMAFDPKGRLIVSPEKGKLCRVTLPQGGEPARAERLPVEVGDAQGLCYAFESLYVNGNGPGGPGLYRLRDRDGDRFEEAALLRKWEGEGEFGPHGVVADEDRLYIVNGRRVKVPAGLSEKSPYRNYGEDLLLPRLEDPNGLDAGCAAPGGHVIRTDPDGKEWELWCGGLNNAYDLAFNGDGELFTFDADTEADRGTPWYAPPQVFHLVSGGEYGWRRGSGKWPVHYHDRLPPATTSDPSSPTGLVFGTKAKFPPKYRQALFAGDWGRGRILAVRLQPEGSTYAGDVEPFLSGKALSVTDLEIGPDGAMYFITGGRGAPSRLFRVSAGDPQGQDEPPPPDPEAAQARLLRRKMEAIHSQQDRKFIQELWPQLISEDRFLRFSARVALERQELRHWQLPATQELIEESAFTAMLALARVGGEKNIEPLMKSMRLYPWGQIEQDENRLACIRTYEVIFCRMKAIPEEEASFTTFRFDSIYPNADNADLNREMSRLLACLKASGAIPRTLQLLSQAKTQEEAMHHALCLRILKEGWEIDQRKAYFAWFARAAGYKGGASLAGYVEQIRRDAMETLTPEERRALGLK